jgi:hypothetical protein
MSPPMNSTAKVVRVMSVCDCGMLCAFQSSA